MASGCLILTFAPPFPAFVIGLALFGFGCALYDSVLTTIVSHEEDTASMSYLYAAFGVSCFIGYDFLGFPTYDVLHRSVRWVVRCSLAGSSTAASHGT